MADRPDDALARGIVNNMIPLQKFEQAGNAMGGAGEQIMQLLRNLGIVSAPAAATPGLNEPLPKFNPQTGKIDYPTGYRGPR